MYLYIVINPNVNYAVKVLSITLFVYLNIKENIIFALFFNFF